MANDFKTTMNLPHTEFPMRAGLAKSEPRRLAEWLDNDVYGQLLKKNEGHDAFILHDGPPYANGPIHCGHAQNKISKDIILRYKAMRGYKTTYVPGWDCHGQPIEHKVESELGTDKFRATPVDQIRKICREYAVKNIDVQRSGFKRLGVLGDWDHPYLTFTHAYDAADIKIFKAIFDKGAIYRGRKPVHWCTHCHTALAEAEIEYADEVSPAIFVRFEMTTTPAGLESWADRLFVDIWTTTPWTLPADQAVILHPQASYVAMIHDDKAEIVAKELAQRCADKFGYGEVELVCTPDGQVWSATGAELAGNEYKQPVFEGEKGMFICADYVTLDDGTGIVHAAPGHGMDDYIAGVRMGVPVVMPVDDDGRFYEGTGLGSGGPWSGLEVNETNPKIISWLEERGSLILHEDMSHSYPHCWRCKKPVIFRATDQWFVSMDQTGLREQALDAINNKVTWYPAHASKRIGSMVEQRPDWCISRQRCWGVPIPSYTCADCGEKVMDDATLDAVIALFEEKGSDAWFTDEPASYLGDACVCPKCGSHRLKADRDILDVWWDSGVSHTAVVMGREELRFPADMYLEGSDQHRGWFQSSLLTSIGAYGVPPFKSVVSQGFTLDEQGRKMSKSLGNGIDPGKVCDDLGADVLRLWVASSDTSTDVRVGNEILKRCSDAYRRFRNTMRFLLSELDDFDPARDTLAFDELLPIDRIELARMSQVHDVVGEAFEAYQFNVGYRALYDYIVTELSNVYFDALKDRTYCDKKDSPERRSAQTVFAQILSMLVRDLQPILVYTCDEVMRYMPEDLREGQAYAALLSWYEAPAEARDRKDLLEGYPLVLAARDVVKKALEEAVAAGTVSKSQEAHVTLTAPAADVETLKATGVDLAEFCIVADFDLVAGEDSRMVAAIEAAKGDRCPRCWNTRRLGEDGLCDRCHDAVASCGAAG